MLGNTPFNFNTIEKIVAAFGWIFSDISIQRTNSSTGAVTQTIKVPITQVEGEKWDARRLTDPNAGDEATQRHVNLVLPRMTYEMTGFRYDPSRKLSSTNYRVAPKNSALAWKQFNPVPMIFSFSLYIQARNLSDGWNVLGQFLPFFKPDFVVPINDIPDMGIQRDITFYISANSQKDSWDGAAMDKRTIEWQYDFEARGHLYPPMKEKKVITEADIRVSSNFPDGTYVGNERSTVVVQVNPPSRQIDEPYDIVTEGFSGWESYEFDNLGIY